MIRRLTGPDGIYGDDAVEISFSGEPLGVCREVRKGGFETLKRLISSESFSTFVITGSPVIDSHDWEWLNDHVGFSGKTDVIFID